VLIPVRITFRGLSPSPPLRATVRERIVWLDQFYDRIHRCDVQISVPHRHQRRGRRFHVRIELRVAGGDPIVVRHEPAADEPTTSGIDAGYAAIHEAFDAARRQLQDFARRQRGAVKARAPHPRPEPEPDSRG
jgi:ribosome-associated translation inhibitor RaiA